jgi:hypothetical protein
MAWYTSSDNSINHPPIPQTWQNKIIHGQGNVDKVLSSALNADIQRLHRPCLLALDGFKGAKLQPFFEGIRRELTASGVEVVNINVNQIFHEHEKIEEIIRPYEKPEDPFFGRVFPGGLLDLIDPVKLAELATRLAKLRSENGRQALVICHGMGAGIQPLRHYFDRAAYCDVTREQIIIRAEKNEILPVGGDTPNGFPWKRIYYVEYPMLNPHKKQFLKAVDWYIDNSHENDPKLLPGEVYHALMTELSGRPVCFKVFYMPGTFGGYEFGKRFRVDGLPNTSWDYEISVGDNHLLVEAGKGRPLELPFYNVFWEHPLRFVGTYSHAKYPGHFPVAIYMQDGSIPLGEKNGFKRTHMPIHLHPDTAYCRDNFGEPLGRYETYYIVRADPEGCTMHGFKEDADIDGFVREIRKSAETKQEFDWRKYIYEHPSKTGELHQIPPGTVHGTGGRQIILEIDTNPSIESTEYSFFIYDFHRPNFNYEKNDFSGRQLRLQMEHGLDIMRRNRKQKFMARHCRPDPVCVREGKDWREMSFPMYYNMPYQINRFEFLTSVEDNTGDMFHCLALTVGQKVRVFSKRDPSNDFILEDCDNIILPACFGEYVCENLGEKPCEIIKTYLITEARDHIDMKQEEKDFGLG